MEEKRYRYQSNEACTQCVVWIGGSGNGGVVVAIGIELLVMRW